MTTGKLSLHNVSVQLGKNPVLQDISFSLKKGETLTVVGPSGCGKSTLLNVLSGIIKNYQGTISMDDVPLDSANLTVGYVPQNLGLLPWKKVIDNILLPEKINPSITLNKVEVRDVLAKLEITHLLQRYPSQLSGGQRQRVALARVFIAHSDILLMDEPFSALDTLTADASRDLFLDLWRKYRPTTIFTTHNLSEAIKMGSHILVLSKQPGTVLKWVKNPLFERQLDESDIEFLSFKHELIQWISEETSKTAAL